MRFRNAIGMIAMLLAAVVLARVSALSLGVILILVGAVFTGVLLLWNLFWVNTVLYRLTREEVEEVRLNS